MKHNFNKLFAAAIFILAVNSYSGVTQEWVRSYNGSGVLAGNNKGSKVIPDDSGNVYVGGYSVRNGYADYTLIKYNSVGTILWSVYYDGPGHNDDYLTAIARDSSGNIIITGRSMGDISTGIDIATIKYNAAGTIQWLRRYNVSNENEIPCSIGTDVSGNIYVTGQTSNNGPTVTKKMLSIKYNSIGTMLWAKTYTIGSGAYSVSMALDISGNVYITGPFLTDVASYFVTVKYNASGTQQWVNLYGYPQSYSNLPVSIAVDNYGNSYVLGSWWNNEGDGYVTVKYNSSGAQLWSAAYNTPLLREVPVRIVADAQGTTYVTGWSEYWDNTLHAYFGSIQTFKYSSSGALQWLNNYGPTNTRNASNDMSMDAFGNVYVTGWRYDSTNDHFKYVTVKYNSSGKEWEMLYGGLSMNNYAYGVAADRNGNVFVTGISFATRGIGGQNIVTVKYSQTPGLNKHEVNQNPGVPSEYSLSQNYPNPFNPSTKIDFSIPKEGFVKLSVYDILGKEIAVLINEKYNAGSYSFEWNASNYPSGTYFYRLVSNGFTETKKLLLVK